MRVTTYLAVFEYDDTVMRRWTLYSKQRQIGMGSDTTLIRPYAIAEAKNVKIDAVVTWHADRHFSIHRPGSMHYLTGEDLNVIEHDDYTTTLEVR